MDEGQWNEAREGAETELAGMLDEAHAVAEAMDGVIEIRIEQRVTVEGGRAHAKWNSTTRAEIFEMTEDEEAALREAVG